MLSLNLNYTAGGMRYGTGTTYNEDVPAAQRNPRFTGKNEYSNAFGKLIVSETLTCVAEMCHRRSILSGSGKSLQKIPRLL
jgi:hypothetical protein